MSIRRFIWAMTLIALAGPQFGCSKNSQTPPPLRAGQPVTGVAGWPINIQQGQTYTGFVASVTVCRGFTIVFSEVVVDWRDGTNDPITKTQLDAGAVNASRFFGSAGQFTAWVSGYATCVNGDSKWNDLFQGTSVVNVYQPISIASIKLVPAILPQNSFSLKNKVTLCSFALPWGSRVDVTSSNPAIAKIFRGPIVPVQAGQTSQYFRIDTFGLTGTVTISATSGGVTKTQRLRVR